MRRDGSWGEHRRLVEWMSHCEDSEKRWVLRLAQMTGREDESLRGLRRDGSWGEPERLVGRVSRWCAKADCCKLWAGNARLLMVISCSWRQWIMLTWLRLMGLDSLSTSLPCSTQDPLTVTDCLSLSLECVAVSVVFSVYRARRLSCALWRNGRQMSGVRLVFHAL